MRNCNKIISICLMLCSSSSSSSRSK